MKRIALNPGVPRRMFLFVLGSLFSVITLSGQGWSVDPTKYANSGEINAVVMLNAAEVSSGVLGAFVGNECRGYTASTYYPPTGKNIFILLIYSNTSGETLTFKYYDLATTTLYTISETEVFVPDMTLGNAISPRVYHALSNSAPQASCPAKSSLPAAPGPMTFNLCNIFTDPDGDNLVFAEDHSAGSTVKWNSACELEFTTAATGTSTLSLSASDGEFTAYCDYSFTINPVNNPPVVSNPVGMLRLLEDFGTKSIDLDTVFSDPDLNNLSYTASSSDGTVVSCSVSGSLLTITEGVPGNATLTLTASDASESVQDKASVVLIASGPALPWQLDASKFTYNGQIDAVVLINGDKVSSGTLGAFVGDECRGMVNGIYFPVTNQTVFSLLCYSNQADGELLTFRYYNSVTSTVYLVEEVIEFVSDMQLGDAVTPRELNINLSNHLPEILTPVPDQTLNEHFGTSTISLAGRYSDPDLTALTLTAKSNNTGIVTVSISGTTLTLTEKGTGSTDVVVSASDGTLVIDDLFKVTVNNVNDPPVIVNPIPDQSLLEGFGSKNIPVSGVFSDPDGNTLSYSVSSNNTAVVTASILGGNLVIIEKGNGIATLSLCVTDGVNPVCDDIQVTVTNVNDPPESNCDGLRDQNYVQGFGTRTVEDICTLFTDPDNDQLTITVTSNAPDVVTASISNCIVTITEQGSGDAIIELCASDGQYSACCEFNVSVVDKNIIDIYLDDLQLYDDDSIKLCQNDTSLILIIYSDLEWSIESGASWITTSKINKFNATVSCSRNTSGADRLGYLTLSDTQENQVKINVFQKNSCIPDLVPDYSNHLLKVYPNPVHDQLQVVFNPNSGSGQYLLELLDSRGAVHYQKIISPAGETPLSIDMSDKVPGTWYLRISDMTSGVLFRIPVLRL
ncbi:MAG: BACON domain-containing protein [Bacteroidota bacterium]